MTHRRGSVSAWAVVAFVATLLLALLEPDSTFAAWVIVVVLIAAPVLTAFIVGAVWVLLLSLLPLALFALTGFSTGDTAAYVVVPLVTVIEFSLLAFGLGARVAWDGRRTLR